jgi:uncharacterized RmlC-like cupin family protein
VPGRERHSDPDIRADACATARALAAFLAHTSARSGKSLEGHIMADSPSRWRSNGVRIIRASELDANTAQTLGMQRRAAVTTERTGATKLWAGTVTIDANAKTGAHHHGDLESVIYVVSGIARLRWGDRLEYVAEAEQGDFIFVPPYVPHQEINASADLQLHCVLARSGQAGLVVNLDIEPAETPELIRWIDDLHK